MTFINPEFQFEEEDEYTELIMQQHDNSFEFRAPSHQKHEIQDKSSAFHLQQISESRYGQIVLLYSRSFTRNNTKFLIYHRSSDVPSVTEQEEQEIEETINEFSNVFRNEVMVGSYLYDPKDRILTFLLSQLRPQKDRFFELRSRLAQHYLKRIRKLEREKEVLCIEHRNTVDKLQGSIAKRDHFLMRFKHLTLGMADTLARQRERKVFSYVVIVVFHHSD